MIKNRPKVGFTHIRQDTKMSAQTPNDARDDTMAHIRREDQLA